MSLHVAINASLDPRAAGGVQTNFVSLLRSLKARGGGMRATLLAPPAIVGPLCDEVSPNFDVHGWSHTFPWYRKTAEDEARMAAPDAAQLAKEERERERLRMERDTTLRKLRAEVVHFPHQVVFDTELPSIYEPWDLQHIALPDLFTRGEREWRTALYSRACRRARLVVTATRATKRDLVSMLGIDAGKILVIPRGSRELPNVTEAERMAAQRELKVQGPYLFYPAMSFPHKNHIRLLEALAILRDRHGLIVPLVCSGRKHAPFWPTIEAMLAKHRLENQVSFVGAVTDTQLAALFVGATALAFPSRFEGLGLPLLEAMQFGVPIAASNTSCIPEVLGEAGLLFDQEDPEAIAAVIRLLWNDEALRRDLSAKALVQRRANTWDAAAETFIEAYRYCAGHGLSADEKFRIDSGLAAW